MKNKPETLDLFLFYSAKSMEVSAYLYTRIKLFTFCQSRAWLLKQVCDHHLTADVIKKLTKTGLYKSIFT